MLRRLPQTGARRLFAAPTLRRYASTAKPGAAKRIAKSTLKTTGIGVAALAVAAGGAATYLYQTDEGVRRTVRFTSYMTPIIWEYWRLNQKIKHLPKEVQVELKQVIRSIFTQVLSITCWCRRRH